MAKPDELAGRQAHDLAWMLKSRRGLRGRPTDWDRLHVTITALHTGCWSRSQAEAVSAAMARLSMRSFVAAFDRVLSFQTANALVLVGDDGVFGLRLLQEEIAERLAASGVGFGKRIGSTPHMTLLRDPQAVPETFVAPVSWTVREVLLIHSIVEERRHLVLGRWPLGRPVWEKAGSYRNPLIPASAGMSEQERCGFSSAR